VVHGGGKEISAWSKRLGLEARFVDGLRATDDDTMTVTEMVLSGLINKELVSLICQSGVRAAGISGRDASLVSLARITSASGADLGRTGDVTKIDSTVVKVLQEAGILPVISPIGSDRSGRALNVNADFAAAALAGALSCSWCIFLTDVTGVRRGTTIAPTLTKREVEEMIAGGEITGGMIPKVMCALRALEAGVEQVVIAPAAAPGIVQALLSGDGSRGTIVTL
jgi:acetylglutamate kinase